ncbi:hypothetical protein [Streptomyces sp. NPDC096193]|uniref:hypothetical protein n=1 Tax=Streptomyces sp. NPDC096193 TaxID=3155821 RepID=UPI003327180D
MTAQSNQPKPSGHVGAAFVRFVLCGGGVGLASSGVLVLTHGLLPVAVANAVITVVSTLIATELHGRVTFRSERGGWGVHLRSGLTVAVSYAFTTGALLVLYAVRPTPSVITEQTVYLTASALAGIARFAVLRVVVFGGERKVRREPVLARTGVARTGVAMAA